MYRVDFFHDFETRSHVNLKAAGTINYATHWSTEATRLSYCFGRTGAVKLWRPLLEPVPAEILEVALHPERYNFIAQNIFFDYLIWICVLSRMIPGLVRPAIENLNDNMALSCYFHTGASLEVQAKFMNLPMGKDPEGRKAMMKSCRPNAKGIFPVLTPHEEAAFDRYALGDTRIMREVYYMLPPLPEPERFAWEWTFRRNLEGIRLDMPLIIELAGIVGAALPQLEAEFESIVGAKVNSHVKVREWFVQFWPWIKDMQQDTVRDMLKEVEGKPAHAVRALQIKDLAGSTAISKLSTAMSNAYMGKIFQVLFYCGAQATKRWSGMGIQMQNFPRVDSTRPDRVDFDMNVEHLADTVRALRPGLKDPIGFCKNLLRRIFLPSAGLTFYCGDFSKIEPTTLFWLLDMGPIPKKWYEELAAEVYNKPIEQIDKEGEERQIGKMGQLLSGYGGGWESFQENVFIATGIWLDDDMAKTVVDAYRRKYPQIVKFWADLESAFRLAIKGQSSMLCNGKVHFFPLSVLFPNFKGVAIRLPSGSHLFYHNAEEFFKEWYETTHKRRRDRIKISKDQYMMLSPTDKAKFVYKSQIVIRYMSDAGGGQIEWKYVYSGLFCENVVSSTARDILLPFVWNAEKAGFDVLGLVHDEGWAQSYPGREAEFKALMCIRPSWCRDMDIQAETKCGVRYLK